MAVFGQLTAVRTARADALNRAVVGDDADSKSSQAELREGSELLDTEIDQVRLAAEAPAELYAGRAENNPAFLSHDSAWLKSYQNAEHQLSRALTEFVRKQFHDGLITSLAEDDDLSATAGSPGGRVIMLSLNDPADP